MFTDQTLPPGYEDGSVQIPSGDDRPESPRPTERKSHRSKADSQVSPVQEAPLFVNDLNVAGILVTLVEGMVVPAIGEKAKFRPDERKLIEPSLGRIMARMSPSAAGHFTALADPILLGTGLLLWGFRVFSVPTKGTERNEQWQRVNPQQTVEAAEAVAAAAARMQHQEEAPAPPPPLTTVDPDLSAAWTSQH